MSFPCISIATVCYMITAMANLKQRDFPMALVWFSYSLANIGFLWYEVTKK